MGQELPIAAARIRLEGQLEVVETALADLRQGLRAAERGDFGPLSEAIERRSSPSVRAAQLAVARLAPRELWAESLRGRTAALLRRANRLVARRARALGLTGATSRELLRALSAEPIACEGRGWSTLSATIFGGMIAASVTFAAHSGDPRLLLFPWGIPAAVGLIFTFVSAPRVFVTGRRLVVGTLVFQLAEVQEVRFQRRMTRSLWPIRLSVTLRSGHVFEKNLQRVPEGCPAVLARRGIAVVRRDGIFGAFY